MPKLPWSVSALVQTFAQDLLIAEGLLFPGVSCLQSDLARLRKMLGKRLRHQIQQLAPGEAYRHRLAESPSIEQLVVEVPPLRGDNHRRSAVTLKLHYAQWRHGSEAQIAYFPALQIEVLASSKDELRELLVPQVQSAFARQKTATHLRNLVLLEQHRALEVRPLSMQIKTPTLKEAAIRKRDRQQKQKSVLNEVAVELAKQFLPMAFERAHDVQRLGELLTRPLPRSVLLVGRSGVGKTAIVRELARQQRTAKIAIALWSTSGARLVAGMTGFGMWQERCERLVREAARRQVVLHLDHLVELIEVGKGGGSSQGVAAVLRPAIAAGKLLSIAECTPEELAVIEREDPQLLEAFVRVDIAATTPEQTRRILERAAEEGRDERSSAPISTDALATLDRLHRRYATYSAAPGRPLRFLRNLLQDRVADHTITAAEVCAAFSHETGLPLFMLDDAMPLDVPATRRWFAQRVIGQAEPVDLVVDLLAAAKAGLARGGKPIASLLFIGPTGVGKTEMAKSLAEFLYQDRGRMIRFDMSEYAYPAAVDRLIGGQGGSQGLLTQKVRDQPFMVVLLDEFEKAHPSFYDVLLQVLGEGRLTDGAGRIADFTSTVVIMTSNLGAESFRHTGLGFREAGRDITSRQHFEREVKSFLRPEMYNRLDRIVPFAPLDEAVIADIATREIDRALNRDGVRLRGVSVTLASDVAAQIAAQGYDARYGARPLKRAIERKLVAPLAEQITNYGAGVAIDCRVQVETGQLRVQSTARPLAGKGAVMGSSADASVTQAIGQFLDLRRKVQALEQSGVLLRIRNDLERQKQLERQRLKRARKRNKRPKFVYSDDLRQADRQRTLLARVDKLSQEVTTLEELTLLELYAARPVDAAFVTSAHADQHSQLQTLLFDLYRDASAQSRILTVAIYSTSLTFACRLAHAYLRMCAANGEATVRRHWLKRYREDLDIYKDGEDPALKSTFRNKLPGVPLPILHLKSQRKSDTDVSQKVVDVYAMDDGDLDAPPKDAIGLSLQVVGPRVIALLETESGKHLFHREGVRHATCYVETSPTQLVNYDPPEDVGKTGTFHDRRERRKYDFSAEICHDALLKRDIAMPDDGIDSALHEAARLYLMQRTWDLIDTWN